MSDESRLTALEQSVALIQQQIASLASATMVKQANLVLESSLNTLTDQVTALDTRVTNLENA